MKSKQLGYKAVYQPAATVYHYISSKRMTHEYFINRYFYQGVCNSYSDIRGEHGKYNDTVNHTNTNTPAVLNSKVSVCQKFKNRIVNYIKRHSIRLDPEEKIPPEIKVLNEKLENALREGYNFHKNAVENNPELLAWVLKKDYWDYRLPNINIKESYGGKNHR